MTDQQINIAIAEAVGWKRPNHPECKGLVEYLRAPEGDWWLSPDGAFRIAHELPNYAGSLDAMHEAEKMLTVKQQWDYCNLLSEEINNATHTRWGVRHATARQCAEAFLRTLNLWEETAR